MRADQDQILDALRRIEDLAAQIGAAKEHESFKKLRERLQAEGRATKDLKGEIFNTSGLAAFGVFRHIRKQPWDEARKKEVDAKFSALKRGLADALYPQQTLYPEADIKRLAGNDESTKVLGDPKDAGKIAEQAMEVVHSFSASVFKGDIERAYVLCANELRTWMSVKRLVTELEKADKNFGGPAVECVIERIPLIEADEVARDKSGNKDADWPKDTPKPNKRATVGTFWFTNPAENKGRWVLFWVTEEPEGYRIAKFQQYLQ